MGKHEVDGIALAVVDYEDDKLMLVGDGDVPTSLGISDLIEQAGGETVRDGVEGAYHGNPYFGRYVQDYLAQGKRWPPLYRVRIFVELEAVSEEEARTYWLSRLRVAKAHFEAHKDDYGRLREPTPWQVLADYGLWEEGGPLQ